MTKNKYHKFLAPKSVLNHSSSLFIRFGHVTIFCSWN